MITLRKIFAVSILLLLTFSCCMAAEVNPDVEIHMAVGGLYSLVSAAALNGVPDPSPESLLKHFADVPSHLRNSIRIEQAKNQLWLGVSVANLRTAKKFLRAHSPQLDITSSPAGDYWFSGDTAWLKAGDIQNGKLIPVTLRAAKGSGKDSELIFFSTKGKNEWWQAYPSFTKNSAAKIIKMFGENHEGLSKPKGVSESIYESVKPAEVKKPADIHTSRRKQFGESYDVNMGDVIFTPIPKTTYRDDRN